MAEEDYQFSPSDFEQDREKLKEIWTIHGEKGTGKTTLALSFNGTKNVLNYDRKAARVRDRMYPGDEDIRVYDATHFYRGVAKEKMTEAGCRNHAYIIALLNKMPQTDWVVHDGLDILIEIEEMKMRHDHQISPFGGVDMNLWKDRKANLREVHGLSVAKAKKGVIYVTNSEESELIEEGRLIRKSKAPRWIDIIASETDNVVRTEMRLGKDGTTEFAAVMVTTKVGPWHNGQVLNVTDKTLFEATAQIQAAEVEVKGKLEELFGS